MLRRRLLPRWVWLCLLIGWSSSSQANPAVVASAANFRATLETLIEALSTRRPSAKFEVVSGSTGLLYAQIQAGAPFDLFFAADAVSPEKLAKSGRSQGPAEVYAVGRLALWAPKNTLPWPIFLSDFKGTLAIANPRLAPYGAAADAALQHNFFQGAPRRVQGNNVVHAFQFVESGNAEAALLSLAQLRLAGVPNEAYQLVPEHYYPPIVQKRILLTQHPDARALVAFMGSADAQFILQEAGYLAPEDHSLL